MNYNEFNEDEIEIIKDEDVDVEDYLKLVKKDIYNDVNTLVHIMRSTLVNFAVCAFSKKYSIDEVLSTSEYMPTLILSDRSMKNNFYFVYIIESDRDDEKTCIDIQTMLTHSFYEIKPNFITPELYILHDESLDSWGFFPLIYKLKNIY